MKSILTIIIFFLFGLGLGYYLHGYQIQFNFGFLGNTIPIASIISMGGIIIDMVIEWRKRLFLKFGDIFKEGGVYFLQVHKARGEESAEECEGLLNTKDIHDYVSVWRFGNVRIKTVTVRDYLRLFELKDGDIIFPSASTDKTLEDLNNPFAEKRVKISDYINESLTVTIGSKNGSKLETTIPISDIFVEKNPNKSRKNQLFNRLKVCFGRK